MKFLQIFSRVGCLSRCCDKFQTYHPPTRHINLPKPQIQPHFVHTYTSKCYEFGITFRALCFYPGKEMLLVEHFLPLPALFQQNIRTYLPVKFVTYNRNHTKISHITQSYPMYDIRTACTHATIHGEYERVLCKMLHNSLPKAPTALLMRRL